MKNQISDSDCAAWRAATCDGLLGYIMSGLEASRFAFGSSSHHKATTQSTEDHLSTQSCFIFYKYLYSITHTELNIIKTRNRF
ncbi:hypothetical protein ACSS6W_004552 [Trichoderma asperelloides]